jgi:hypothetical protein
VPQQMNGAQFLVARLPFSKRRPLIPPHTSHCESVTHQGGSFTTEMAKVQAKHFTAHSVAFNRKGPPDPGIPLLDQAKHQPQSRVATLQDRAGQRTSSGRTTAARVFLRGGLAGVSSGQRSAQAWTGVS